jgi:hypothetical protein
VTTFCLTSQYFNLHSSTLKIEVLRSSEILVSAYKTTRCYKPEHYTLKCDLSLMPRIQAHVPQKVNDMKRLQASLQNTANFHSYSHETVHVDLNETQTAVYKNRINLSEMQSVCAALTERRQRDDAARRCCVPTVT